MFRTYIGEGLRGLALLAVVVGTLLVPTLASAQNRLIVIEDSEFVVDLEKPSAYYMLAPSNLEYQEQEAEASFLEELYETVETEPF